MKVVLYGAGERYCKFANNIPYITQCVYGSRIEIIGVCDGDRLKWNTPIRFGEKLYWISNIMEIKDYDKVLITATDENYELIRKDLVTAGIKEGLIAPFDQFINEAIYSHNRKYKMTLVLIIKNEARYVVEWIEYHRLIGVEHFYIYDDNSDDNLKILLAPYIKRGIVTYTLWEHEKGQNKAYYDATMRYGNETVYMGFIDTDEFIVIKNDNIYELLESIRKEYEDNPYKSKKEYFGGIGITFRYYGSSNFAVPPDGLVTENYLYRCNDDFKLQTWIKSIVNPRTLIGCAAHSMKYIDDFVCISEKGSVIPDNVFCDSPYNKIWINHYWCKSDKDLWEKLEKGSLAGIKGFMRFEDGDTDEIKEYKYKEARKLTEPWNEVYDPVLSEYATEIKRIIKNGDKEND